jgi:protein-disulfide isomerase
MDLSKQVAGGFIVAACVAATVVTAHSLKAPSTETAPDYRSTGEAAAKITIAEFSDFECPACRAAEEPLKQLRGLYGKDIRFLFKQYPLERVHRNARAAAIAAECMGRQGKFWPFHDALYANQEQWGELEDPRPFFAKFEKEAGADPATLKTCESDATIAAAIDADKLEARNRWVAATPTFFINGKRFVGARQLSTRGPSWIEKELKRK